MAKSTSITEMKQSLREAGAFEEGMTLEEIKRFYAAIFISRNDSSVQIDDEDSNNDDSPATTAPRDNAQIDYAPLGASTPTDVWLTKSGDAAGGNQAKRFSYRIPKVSVQKQITPLEELSTPAPKKYTRLTKVSVQAGPAGARRQSTDDDNEFAALNNGDPRDLPRLKMRAPILQEPRTVYPRPPVPPYNDPAVACLPYAERYELIGQYFRAVQERLDRAQRESKVYASWGKPIQSSNRFQGTLDKVPLKGKDVMEYNEEIEAENLGTITEHAVLQTETDGYTESHLEEVRTNMRPQRKRKVLSLHTDYTSADDIDDFVVNADDDPSYSAADEKKRKLASAGVSAAAGPSSATVESATAVVRPLSRSALQEQQKVFYDELMVNRPEINLTKVAKNVTRGRARGSGRGRGRGNTNEAIMQRSTLFKDGASTANIGSRNRRMTNLAEAEEKRKFTEAKEKSTVNDYLNNLLEGTDQPEITDDEDEPIDPNFKRRRIPVPLVRGRRGSATARRNPPQTESTMKELQVTTRIIPVTVEGSDEDVELLDTNKEQMLPEKEVGCPLCNTMFSESLIQVHAENCQGADTIDKKNLLLCTICDKVFIADAEYEIHVMNCMQAASQK